MKLKEKRINFYDINEKLINRYFLIDKMKGFDPSLINYSEKIINIKKYFSEIPILNKLVPSLIARLLKYFPISSVRFLKIKRQEFIKGHALVLSGLAILNNSEDENRDKYINILVQNILSKKIHNKYVWSHDIPYYIKNIYINDNTPNIITTGFVAKAFWDLYFNTKENKWLEIFKSIVEDMISVFPYESTNSGICFMYTPITKYYVHNANLIMAELIAKYCSVIENKYFFELINKSVNYSTSHIISVTGFPYAGPPTENITFDNYHTSYVLESLMEISFYCGKKIPCYEKIDLVLNMGKELYFKSFIRNKKVVKDKSNVLESHSLATSIIMYILYYKSLKIDKREEIKVAIDSTIRELWNINKKYFIYNIRNIFFGIYSFKNNLNMIRWSSAWMIKALSYYLKRVDSMIEKNKQENMIFDVLFVIIYLFFPFCIYYILNYSGLKILEFSIKLFLIHALFVFSYIGILILYFNLDEYRYILGVNNKNIIFLLFFYSSYSIFGITMGYVFLQNVLRISNKNYLDCPYISLTKSETINIWILFLISLIILIVYISKVPEIALWVAIREGFKQGKIARSLMTNAFAGKYHWYNLFLTHISSVITFIAFSNFLITNRKHGKTLFILSLIFSIFTSVMSTVKSLIVWLFVGLFLVYTIVKFKGKYPVKKVLILIIFLIILLMFFYIVFMGSRGIIPAINSVLSRTLTGQITPAYYYLEYFPNVHDFLYGKSFPNPKSVFPFESFKLTVEISKWKFPNLASAGVVGSVPTVFWGEMYANFGISGVLIFPFFVGIGIFMIENIIIRIKNCPIKIGLLVWLAIHYKNLSSTGLSSFFIDFYLIMIFIIMFTLVLICNKFKIKYIK